MQKSKIRNKWELKIYRIVKKKVKTKIGVINSERKNVPMNIINRWAMNEHWTMYRWKKLEKIVKGNKKKKRKKLIIENVKGQIVK